MRKFALFNVVVSLLALLLLNMGCPKGPNGSKKVAGRISDKNQKILGSTTQFDEESYEKEKEVFAALVNVITEDLNTREIANNACKANINKLLLMGSISDSEAISKSKACLLGVSKLSDEKVRQEVKEVLEQGQIEFIDTISSLKRPKNVLVALEDMEAINDIWAQAKNNESAKGQVQDFLNTKLSDIKDAKERKKRIRSIMYLIDSIDKVLYDLFLNPWGSDEEFGSISPKGIERIFNELVNKISDSLDNKTLAKICEVNINIGKLKGKIITDADAQNKLQVCLNKVQDLKVADVRALIKRNLDAKQAEIIQRFWPFQTPKNLEIAIANLNQLNSIWARAKSWEEGDEEVFKLLNSQLQHITEESDRKYMFDDMNSFLYNYLDPILAPLG